MYCTYLTYPLPIHYNNVNRGGKNFVPYNYVIFETVCLINVCFVKIFASFEYKISFTFNAHRGMVRYIIKYKWNFCIGGNTCVIAYNSKNTYYLPIQDKKTRNYLVPLYLTSNLAAKNTNIKVTYICTKRLHIKIKLLYFKVFLVDNLNRMAKTSL